MADPNIPHDATDQTTPAYECGLSPNDFEFVPLAPHIRTRVAPTPPAPTPGAPPPPTPSSEDPVAGVAGSPDGHEVYMSTHPIRAHHDTVGTDLTFHLAGVAICNDGYERPVWVSGDGKRVCIGEFWIWDEKSGDEQVGSGYEFALMVNDQPETSLVLFSGVSEGIIT